MDQWIFYAAGASPALPWAVTALEERGIRFAQSPDRTVTHLLVPAPCREDLRQVMKELSLDVAVVGGALDQPAFGGYPCYDLLKDPFYLAKNAQITAHCAVQLAMEQLPVTLDGCPVLLLGWGRIGKCLSKLLRDLGAEVTVAVRKAEDRALAAALGFETADIHDLDAVLGKPRLICNTVPAAVLDRRHAALCAQGCLKLDLASRPGIDAPDVVDARGLPGLYAPESAGTLIAETVLRLLGGKEEGR